MLNEDLNMDEVFKKAAGDVQASYNANFWKDMESQLNDELMDKAFRDAAASSSVNFAPPSEESLADSFLDNAFFEASKSSEVAYNSLFWREYVENFENLAQDVSFTEASNNTLIDYHPAYWSDADAALQVEGLHYEYRTAYWHEVKNLLDKSDKKIFFYRWSAAAIILLLLSFGFYNQNDFNTHNESVGSSNSTAQFGILAINNNSTNFIDNIANNQIENKDNIVENNASDAIFNSSQNEQNNSSNQENTVQSNQLVKNETLSEIALKNSVEFLNKDFAEVKIENSNKTELYQESTNQVDESLSGLFSLSRPQNLIVKNENATITNAPEIEITNYKPSASHELSVIASSGLGNRYSKVEFIPSLRTQFGFEYMRTGYGKLNGLDLGFSLTMNHARQNGIGTERRVNVYNEYGGVDKFWYKLQLKDMIYANVSFNGAIEFARKQKLRFAVGLDYLMFVQSNLSYKIDTDEGIQTVNNNWGVKEGLSKFDIKLGLGYEFKFTPRFSALANASIGFLDRTDDKFIQKSIFDQEMNLTLGLKYAFLRIP